MAAVGPDKIERGRRPHRPRGRRRPIRVRCGCSRGAEPTRWRRRCCTRKATKTPARARRARREAARLLDLRSGRCGPVDPPGVSGAALHRACRRRPTAISTAYATWTGISGDRFYKNAPGADFTTFTDAWVNTNIRSKGPLGKLYPIPCCIHEGDTPSFLGLINNGLASFMSPTYGGWGGRYVWRHVLRRDTSVLDAGRRFVSRPRQLEGHGHRRRRQDLHVGSGDDLALAHARSSTTSPRAWTGRSRTRRTRITTRRSS